jgi:hypothetical protein
MFLSTTQRFRSQLLRIANEPSPLAVRMKFLLKVAVLAAAAKFVLHTPQGPSAPFDRVDEISMRSITHHVDTVFARLGATLKSMLS